MPMPKRAHFAAMPVCLVMLIGCGSDEPEKPKIKTREVIGKTTQDVRRAAPELAAGAEVATTAIKAVDPITVNGQAYVRSIDKLTMLTVQHAIDLYQAEHGDYPKTYEEFMEGIIKPGQPDGLRLPQLPYYQEYAYDEKEHKLIVLEYPERKKQMEAQR